MLQVRYQGVFDTLYDLIGLQEGWAYLYLSFVVSFPFLTMASATSSPLVMLAHLSRASGGEPNEAGICNSRRSCAGTGARRNDMDSRWTEAIVSVTFPEAKLGQYFSPVDPPWQEATFGGGRCFWWTTWWPGVCWPSEPRPLVSDGVLL